MQRIWQLQCVTARMQMWACVDLPGRALGSWLCRAAQHSRLQRQAEHLPTRLEEVRRLPTRLEEVRRYQREVRRCQRDESSKNA